MDGPRPRSAKAAREEVKTKTHKMLLESGIPALLEKLLADCFMCSPAQPLAFVVAGLENHAAGKPVSPAAPDESTPAGLKKNFEQSAREILSIACVSLMKDLVKANPEDPVQFALARLRSLQQELEGGSGGGSGCGADDGGGADDDEMTEAAMRIQAVQRGKAARKERDEMTGAATKIQAVQRGKAARKGQASIEGRLLAWSKE